jgi:Acetyltransferase (GNAT) domain
MNPIETLRPSDRAWNDLLDQAQAYDFYHLPAYHQMAEAQGEGEAVLFSYREGACIIALPLLLRRIADAPGLNACDALDATSVYGYPGPVVSGTASRPVIRRFQQALTHALRERDVVSVFSRLHPLLPQADCLQGLGRIEAVGPTIAIDLRRHPEEQRAGYRRNHKHGINKLKRLGVECQVDPTFAHLDDFIRLYRETMTRVEATSYYFFDRMYFERLRTALGERMHLYVCRLDGEVICGGLFVQTGDIVQYHLGASDGRHLKSAPMKLTFDTVRQDFSGRGAAWFHLGGGLGAQRDSLFHFKSGFGGEERLFSLWKWVVQEDLYDALCRRRTMVAQEPSNGFFPRYRSGNPAADSENELA